MTFFSMMANKRKQPQSRWEEYEIVDESDAVAHVSFEKDENLCKLLDSYDACDAGVGEQGDAGRKRLSPDVEDASIFAQIHEKWKHKHADSQGSSQSGSFDPHKKKSKKAQILDCIEKFSPILSIGIFFFDVTTDILLAIDYYQARTWEYFSWTIGFIVFPSFITCVLGLRLYMLDYSREKEEIRKAKDAGQFLHLTPTWLWFIRLLITLLQLGPVIRYIEHFYNGIKSRDKKLDVNTRQWHYISSKWDAVDVTMLRLFESFLESAPQLLVQLCILIIDKPDLGDVFTVSKKTLAMLSSWIGSSWSLVACHKALRNYHNDKKEMKLKAIPVYFLWRLLEVGPRVLVFAFFASSYHYWIFLLIAVHWMIMSGWLLSQKKTQFFPKKYEQVFFKIICGLILVFCFLNVKEGHTRYRMLVYYIIFYTENLVLMLVWYFNTVDVGQWFHIGGMVITAITPILHITVTLFYYYCCHPTKNIKLCLTGEDEAYKKDVRDDKSNNAVEMVSVKADKNESPPESNNEMISMKSKQNESPVISNPQDIENMTVNDESPTGNSKKV